MPGAEQPATVDCAAAAPQHLRVYVGTYTQGDSRGIYVYNLDLATGALTEVGVTKSVNPSFVTVHPNRRFLFAVNEVTEYQGQPAGAVSAYSIDPQTGKLTFLNQQSSRGGAPCHLVVDNIGKHVLVANYVGGNAAVLPIEPDGSLKGASSVVQHEGSGANPRRQEAPHAHSINLDAANKFAFVADLGIDKIQIYRYEPKSGTLTANDPAGVSLKAGAGPRHFAFHPNGRYAYVINELDSTVTALAYDAENGTLTTLQSVPTLPADYTGNSSTAEVQVHPSGKFLYGSNRGHDSLVIYQIAPQTGMLTYVGHQSTLGKTPRNFAIDPTGQYVLAANQATDNLVVFRVDQQTGRLTPTGTDIHVPAAVCIKMVPID